MTTTINLGDTVRDTITKFTGVAIAKYAYLNGCIRFEIQPAKLDKDGKPIESRIYDVQQLKLIKSAKPAASRDTGGPYPTPPRR